MHRISIGTLAVSGAQNALIAGFVGPIRILKRMVFVMVDGTITDDLKATTGPLEFFDQVLG